MRGRSNTSHNLVSRAPVVQYDPPTVPDSIPGTHRRALATRKLMQAGMDAPGLEAEKAELGLGPGSEIPRAVPSMDWARLVHKSGLDRELRVEEVVYESWASYVARCRLLGSGASVALKVLSPALYEEPVLVDRFEREGHILRSIAHQNVVKLVDSGTYGYARWLMLEWIDGQDLRAALAKGPLDVATAVRLVLGLTAGLAELHRHGMIHRDVKPDNVLWDQRAGRAVLADFGIAKLSKLRADDLTLTGTEDVLGTLGYIPPEAKRGVKHVDARVDVFAAGIVLLELTTGECAPKSHDADWRPRSVDPAIDPIIRTSTAFDRADRYPDAAAMHAALRAVRPRGLLRRLFGKN